MSSPFAPQPTATGAAALAARVAELTAQLAHERAQLAEERTRADSLAREREELTRERDALRASFERLRLELELLKRRIYVAKAERVDTHQLEMEFAEKLAALTQLDAQLASQLGQAPAVAGDEGSPMGPGPKKRPAPKGRRDLRELKLPQQRVELTDPVMEALVVRGEATRMGFEESMKLAWQRGGHVCLVMARAKYKVPGTVPEEAQLSTTPMPPQTLDVMAAPSLLAHVAVGKYCDGLPLFRIADAFARDGVPVDRATLGRWLEDMGATLGVTVLEACRREAMATAFCLCTDATGIAVQPTRMPGKRQPCRRGHYFVHLADKDYVFFEYTPKETSRAVAEMFRGFAGYMQLDAKSVYDVLFVSPEERRRRLEKTGPPLEDDDAVRVEVGCWSHGRRKFWEAAVVKDAVAREALFRIGRLFALEEAWRGRPHAEVHALRQQYSRPHLEAFFAWAKVEAARVEGQRGPLRSAFGYALRNEAALCRFLEDGRLQLTNNASERALRKVAVGRKAWLFVGSDDHAQAAGNLLSLIATARLHGLEPEGYLRDVLRVLAHWPKDRYLELSPKYWAATRARLDMAELAAEVGPLTVPPPLDATAAAEEKTAAR
jgi:transposase